MAKIAVLFPGQGSQAVGMGQDIYEKYESARAFLQQASQASGLDLEQLCFGGPAEVLALTENTQPALVAVEGMIWHVLQDLGFSPEAAAGLSLGEYSALAAAGALTFVEAAGLVAKRGAIMASALPAGTTTMAAVLGMDGSEIAAICQQAPEGDVVEVANYNCPGQVVIGGEHQAVLRASDRLLAAGARRVVPLNVSGAFHTSLLQEAGLRLRSHLDQVMFKPMNIPVLFNTTGNYQDRSLEDLLQAQISSPVHFEASVRRLLAEGFDTFVEVGPGKTLSGFVKKIDRKARVLQVEDLAGIEHLKQVLGGISSEQ